MHNNIKIFVLVGLTFFALYACQNSFEKEFEQEYVGKAIAFRVDIANDIITRTSYSDDIIGGDENGIGGIERIDWTPDDQVRVYMYNQTLVDHDYYVRGIQVGEDQRESHGYLVSEQDDLSWDGWGNYEFYSVYPANAMGSFTLNPNGQSGNQWYPRDVLTLTLPATQYADVQENMQHHAYMAAVSTGVTSGETVELRYYPMVSTLFFTLKNISDAPVTLTKVSLQSSQYEYEPWQNYAIPLTGSYKLWNEQNRFVSFDDTERNSDLLTSIFFDGGKVLQKNESTRIVFFIRPRQYYAAALNLQIFTNEQGVIMGALGDNKNELSILYPYKKYKFNINLNGEKWPYPDVADVSDALAQMIIAYLRKLDNMLSYEYYKDIFEEYFGFVAQPDGKTGRNLFEEKWWPDLTKAANASNDWGRLLSDLFSSTSNRPVKDGALEAFLERLSTITEISIPDGDGIKSGALDASDFMFFKNLKTATLMTEKDLYIHIKDHKSLESLIFKGNGHIYIYIENCSNLTKDKIRTEGNNTITFVESCLIPNCKYNQ